MTIRATGKGNAMFQPLHVW